MSATREEGRDERKKYCFCWYSIPDLWVARSCACDERGNEERGQITLFVVFSLTDGCVL